jgi:hypothetical protein
MMQNFVVVGQRMGCGAVYQERGSRKREELLLEGGRKCGQGVSSQSLRPLWALSGQLEGLVSVQER